jgi:hypothetical protein
MYVFAYTWVQEQTHAHTNTQTYGTTDQAWTTETPRLEPPAWERPRATIPIQYDRPQKGRDTHTGTNLRQTPGCQPAKVEVSSPCFCRCHRPSSGAETGCMTVSTRSPHRTSKQDSNRSQFSLCRLQEEVPAMTRVCGI